MKHSFAMCFIYKNLEVRKSITQSYATVCFIAMKNKNENLKPATKLRRKPGQELAKTILGTDLKPFGS